MFISLKRIIKIGWKEFSRNMGLSLATLFIMTTVIFLVTVFFFLGIISREIISEIESKVDVSVYFKEEALEEEINTAQFEISRILEVKEIKYIAKDQVLANFIEVHKDDAILIESLTELGYNPFLDTLNIKTWEPSQYEQLSTLLEGDIFKEIIDKVDYHQRKEVIEKVFGVTAGVNKIIIFFSILFGIVAVLISFNTVRIAIYNSKEEISVMKLVGASNGFVRGPFIIQGIIIGFISALITFLISFGLTYGLNSQTESILTGINIFNIFLDNFLLLLIIQLVTGVGLGALSSYLAIRKYLKV